MSDSSHARRSASEPPQVLLVEGVKPAGVGEHDRGGGGVGMPWREIRVHV